MGTSGDLGTANCGDPNVAVVQCCKVVSSFCGSSPSQAPGLMCRKYALRQRAAITYASILVSYRHSTINKKIEKRLETVETECWWRLLKITSRGKQANEKVRQKAKLMLKIRGLKTLGHMIKK